MPSTVVNLRHMSFLAPVFVIQDRASSNSRLLFSKALSTAVRPFLQ